MKPERKKTIKQKHQEIIDNSLRLVKELATSKFPEVKDKVRLARMTEAHFIYLVALPYTISKIINNEFELDTYDSLIDSGLDSDGLFERLRPYIDENRKLTPRMTTTDMKDVTLPDNVAMDDHEALPELNLSLQPDLSFDDLDGLAGVPMEDEPEIILDKLEDKANAETESSDKEDELVPFSLEDIAGMKDMVK